MLKSKVLVLALIALPVFAADPPPKSEPDFPLYNEPVVNGNIYECRPQHYQPPCRKIGERAADLDLSDEAQAAEFIAAIRASRSKAPTPVIIDKGGAIPQCGPNHGQSACCRITHEYEDATGRVVIIECGQR